MSPPSKASTSKVRKFKHVFSPPNNGPKVPNEIQTSLLQVGMRVRKSVGVGYKTYSDYDKALMGTKSEMVVGARKCYEPLYGIREDPVLSKTDLPAPSANIYTDFPSSQESLSTVGSAAEPVESQSRKRALDFEKDEDSILAPLEEEDLMDAVTTHLRPIAQPKSRKQPPRQPQACADRGKDDEDFGEADFLELAKWDRTRAACEDF